MSPCRVAVDTGGTFTDLVLVEEETGARRTVKVPSTPREPAAAVFEALERSGVAGGDVAEFVLGTTIATNCLHERKGQRVVFLTTAGFEDVPFIQRINRPELFNLQWVKPVPYAARPDCVGVRERIAYDGSTRIALEPAEIERVVGEVARRDAESPGGVAVAICLLFSYVDSEHERRLAAAIRAALPDVPLSVSHELAPIWREYERSNTVIVDAYLRRLVADFADELDAGLLERGVTGPRYLLKSNGGQVPAHAAARQPVNLVLSGLAGGMIAGKHFADAVGREDVITLDMGGTSADVGVVVAGRIHSSTQYEFEWGLPIAVPVVDLSTIGAGGSSIAGFDQGGFLKVGPESAGAEPGPASYGRGGEQPTVTDAHLALGRLNPGYFLGGELSLDEERARRALEPVAAGLGLGLEDTALAIVDMATENMANAIRLLATDRGLDYRRFDLMAFGGAGPLHGAQLMRRIGLPAVIVPPSPGLASAFGALVADLRVDRRLTRLLRSDLATDAELREGLERISSEAIEELRLEGALQHPVLALNVSCRYHGQNFERDVSVPVDAPGDLAALTVERFHQAHEENYGYRLDDAVVEFVHLNAVAIQAREAPRALPAAAGTDGMPVAVRPVYHRGSGWVETPIYRRERLGAGERIEGPAVIEEVDSTTLVLDGQVADVDRTGSLIIVESGARGGATARREELARA